MGKPNEHGVTLDGEEDFSGWEWKDTDDEPDTDDLAAELLRLGEALQKYHARAQDRGIETAKLVVSELARTCSFNLSLGESPATATLELWFFDEMALKVGFLDLIDQEIKAYSYDDGYGQAEDIPRFIAMFEEILVRLKAIPLRKFR